MTRSAQSVPLLKREHSSVDSVWERLRGEAQAVAQREPELAAFMQAHILRHASLEEAVVWRIAARLGHPDFEAAQIAQAFASALAALPNFAHAVRADINAVLERDPACTRILEPVLYFKGFQAIQTHRLAHWLWSQGRTDSALYLQSRASSVFQVDIHPAAPFGTGIFLDHATGLVVGSTAVVEDEVSLLQGVTLGGTGKNQGDRHPKIRHGVLIGAGATVLGNIEIGAGARIAAGSVVLAPVPPHTTVAGVPARVVGRAPSPEPSRSMDQMLGGFDDFDPII